MNISIAIPVTVSIIIPIEVEYELKPGEGIPTGGEENLSGFPIVDASQNEDLIKASLESASSNDIIMDAMATLQSAVECFRNANPNGNYKANITPCLGLITEFDI
jgi:hypothetical protein